MSCLSAPTLGLCCKSSVLCRPAAPAEDGADIPTAGTDEADGASTSEIMDMIEELVEEAGTSEDAVSLHYSNAIQQRTLCLPRRSYGIVYCSTDHILTQSLSSTPRVI